MQVLVVLVAILGVAYGQYACKGKEDGEIPNYGCVGYTICVGGKDVLIDCSLDDGKNYNPNTKQCDYRENISGPCGATARCAGIADGRYVDGDWCVAYYTCYNGKYLGHNICPDGLVFNKDSDFCDWVWNTPPPCGTKRT